MKDYYDHEAEGEPVVTIFGGDGVRWACRVCNETVFQRHGRWLHFGETPRWAA